MAVIKHISVKGSNGGDALNYVLYKHNEKTGELIVDVRGNPVMRDEYYLDGINCEPYSFAAECKEVNDLYGKNQLPGDIKAHHFIISYDPKDSFDYGLTGPKAQQLSMEWADRCLPGFQMIVCTHMDGSNESGNIHTHIMMNSLRKYDTDLTAFGERDIDHKAGYKLHLTEDCLQYMKKELMSICDREGLHQVDLLSPAKDKITDKEYYTHRHRQDHLNNEDKQHNLEKTSPSKTVFQTQKQYIREAVKEVASKATSFDVFCNIIKEQYGVTVKESRGRISYLHPGREKYITGRALGSDYEKDAVLMMISGERIASQAENSRATYFPGDTLFKIETLEDCKKVFVMQSDLKLVVRLQDYAKAKTSAAYANKVTISNVKSMAETILFVQRNGFASMEDLKGALSIAVKEGNRIASELIKRQDEIKSVNEEIYHMGQYLTNKKVFSEFKRSTDKQAFSRKYEKELTSYEEAVAAIKSKYSDGPFPILKELKNKKTILDTQVHQLERESKYLIKQEKMISIALKNIDGFLSEKSQGHITLSVDDDKTKRKTLAKKVTEKTIKDR